MTDSGGKFKVQSSKFKVQSSKLKVKNAKCKVKRKKSKRLSAIYGQLAAEKSHKGNDLSHQLY
jgi:hypothetical protein